MIFTITVFTEVSASGFIMVMWCNSWQQQEHVDSFKIVQCARRYNGRRNKIKYSGFPGTGLQHSIYKSHSTIAKLTFSEKQVHMKKDASKSSNYQSAGQQVIVLNHAKIDKVHAA